MEQEALNTCHHNIQHTLSLSLGKQKNMISLQAYQTSFKPNKHALFQTTGAPPIKKNHMLISLCSSKDSSDSSGDNNPSQGDTRKQDMLARIAMLQTSKVRLTDYLDKRSDYLTQFAEEANTELDQIGEEALKGLDEASSRIMDNIESRIQAFEEENEMSKIEIERSEKELSEFEDQIEKGRNEGLFFQNLTENKPIEKPKAKEVVQKIKRLTIDNTGSKTRRNLYLGLIALLITGIANSLLSSPSSWQKPVILVLILVGVLSQVIYEQRVLSETTETEEDKSKNEEE